MMTSKFERVKQNELCAGCGLCGSVFSKIDIKYSEKGYIRPYTKEELTVEEDEMFGEFCPGYTIKHNLVGVRDYVWGSHEDIVLSYSTDEGIREMASSGGVLSSLLIFLLETGKIDAVIHIGAAEDNPLLNEVKISYTKEEILSNAGSRYSPSAPLSNIADLLESDRVYAFVGKPCDAGALRMFAKVDKRVEERIPYILSFFCAGVPSTEGTKNILRKFNVKEEEVRSFRYRGEGWPGLTKIVTKNGRTFTMKYEESWGKILNRTLQRRCKICIDGIGEFADIVCGDGWFGDKKGYPKFEEGKGRSLVVIRNQKGKEIFEEALKQNYVAVESKVDFKYMKNIQPFQYDRRTTLIAKILSMKLFNIKTPIYSWKVMFKSAKYSNIKGLARTFAGTSKRIIDKRL
ncbi:Coenzyme F420 hydrogenase/dehydrogenase, beta subunit C-terminal domain [Clostridium thermarum]|uniref:Coenzyme F420 hydrogenase/dehydrogenase, beta subunit C-terminal domain n=1 Tax=Clostridium thermarum TaxID=1716543 RepID=UPI0013D4AB6B|nr:Coenzyme F420 hydrogenase/dehydrogenase, beta subunit C-terminal domain [Clostridium thermarum]